MPTAILNFCRDIDFKEADPLLSLLRGSLLYYDHITVGKFPLQNQQEYILGKLRSLNECLDNRIFVQEDDGGPIRVVVLMGFDEWEFLGSPFPGLPSVKVSWIDQNIKEIFTRESLRKRLELFHVIVKNPDHPHAELYSHMAFTGYCSTSDEWPSEGEIDFDEIIMTGNDHSDENALHSFIGKFKSYLTSFESRLRSFDMGIADDYRKEVEEKAEISGLTLDKFAKKDASFFKEALLAPLTKRFGLKRFGKRRFFIVPTMHTPLSMRLRCDTHIKLLLQLLCSMDTNELSGANSVFLTDKLYEMMECTCDNVPFDQYLLYLKKTEEFVDSMEWKHDKELDYLFYKMPVTDSDKILSNEKVKLDSRQDELVEIATSIPAFFGKNRLDWNWYKSVISKLDAISEEEIEEIPLELSPVMNLKLDKAEKGTESYEHLSNSLKECYQKRSTPQSNVDYGKYIATRQKILGEIDSAKEELKKRMKFLGMKNHVMLLTISVIAAASVFYAIHFLYKPLIDSPVWIGAAIVAFVLSACLAFFISLGGQKRRIRETLNIIITKRLAMKDNYLSYLNDVSNLSESMRKTYVLNKNIEEMEKVLGQFDRHNRSREIWSKFLKDTVDLLRNLRTGMFGKNNATPANVNTEHELIYNDKSEDLLEGMPSIPYQVHSRFSKMRTTVSLSNVTYSKEIADVTCLAKSFKFRRYPD